MKCINILAGMMIGALTVHEIYMMYAREKSINRSWYFAKFIKAYFETRDKEYIIKTFKENISHITGIRYTFLARLLYMAYFLVSLFTAARFATLVIILQKFAMYRVYRNLKFKELGSMEIRVLDRFDRAIKIMLLVCSYIAVVQK